MTTEDLKALHPQLAEDLAKREAATSDVKGIAIGLANDVSRKINGLRFSQETKDSLRYPHIATLEYLIQELQKRV